MKNDFWLNGFSLIEVLVSLGVFCMLLGLGFLFGIDFYKSYVFNSEKQALVSLLFEARSKSMSNINQAPFGLRLENGKFVVFEGSSYVENSNKNFVYQTYPEIVSTGDNEIIFEQLSGRVAEAKSFTLFDRKRSVNISVNKEGVIEW